MNIRVENAVTTMDKSNKLALLTFTSIVFLTKIAYLNLKKYFKKYFTTYLYLYTFDNMGHEAEKLSPFELFEICLHQEEYFPGEIISGKLLIVTSKSIKTAGIYLRFEGRGSVRWKNRPSYLCGLQEAEYVKENQKYFTDTFRYDLDSLPEGSSVLTFDFELPRGIPQTIEAGSIMKQLKVCYSVEATIRYPMQDYRREKFFVVKGIFNLIGYPELSFPLCKTIKEAVFESCWSSSGRVVVMSFLIRKQGFVPGEQINAELVIEDSYRGKTPLLAMQALLVQEIDLTIRTASRVRRRIVAKSDIVHVSTNANDTPPQDGKGTKHKRMLKFHVRIPEEILITYGNTEKLVHDFINVQYFLRLSIEQKAFPYTPLHIHLPIKIGSVFIKEQRAPGPILLAPVPLTLPRPRAAVEEESKKWNPNDMKHVTPVTTSGKSKSVPEIVVSSKSPSTKNKTKIEVCNSSNVSPRLAKSVLATSSGTLLRLPEKTTTNSDSESFRSGVEELK